jgi:hypothetical protein
MALSPSLADLTEAVDSGLNRAMIPAKRSDDNFFPRGAAAANAT